MTFFKNLCRGFLDFVYPSFCLHCNESMDSSQGHFCQICAPQLELINPKERCPYCFSSDYDPEKRVCYPCFIEKPILKRTAAAFDYLGPAATIVTKMKYANHPYLAKGAGAFLAVQFFNLGWPEPDLIVPIPLTFSHQISRGYNQSFLLSESLGCILKKPVKNLLRRSVLDISQAGLNQEQRSKLSSSSFSLKKGTNIQDKIILLVDDVYTTGKTMNACAERLYEGFPTAVYGLSLCRTN